MFFCSRKSKLSVLSRGPLYRWLARTLLVRYQQKQTSPAKALNEVVSDLLDSSSTRFELRFIWWDSSQFQAWNLEPVQKIWPRIRLVWTWTLLEIIYIKWLGDCAGWCCLTQTTVVTRSVFILFSRAFRIFGWFEPLGAFRTIWLSDWKEERLTAARRTGWSLNRSALDSSRNILSPLRV